MREISEEGIDLIKRFESFRAEPYICMGGYPTIGYGHVIKLGEEFSHITILQAEELLQKDISAAECAVLRNINVPLADNQFSALVSFTFNVGGAALQRSTLRQKLNRSEYGTVPKELLRWVWAGNKKLPGLINRRAYEANLFLAAK